MDILAGKYMSCDGMGLISCIDGWSIVQHGHSVLKNALIFEMRCATSSY